jgi:hypothetical protein
VYSNEHLLRAFPRQVIIVTWQKIAFIGVPTEWSKFKQHGQNERLFIAAFQWTNLGSTSRKYLRIENSLLVWLV